MLQRSEDLAVSVNVSQYTAEKVKPDNFWSTSLLVFQCSPISLTPALYCRVHPIPWTYTVRGNAKDKEAKMKKLKRAAGRTENGKSNKYIKSR